MSKLEDAKAKAAELAQGKLHNNTKSDATAPAQASDNTIEELAALPVIEYEQKRAAAAKIMGVRASVLDDQVKRKRKPEAEDSGVDSIFPNRDPSPEPIADIGAVLDAASALILKHMAMDEHWGDVTAVVSLHLRCRVLQHFASLRGAIADAGMRKDHPAEHHL